MVGRRLFAVALGLGLGTAAAPSQVFQLPTRNRALFETGGETRYFAPTPGRTWESGTFGCVRSDGHQLHEGIDIKFLQRDPKGEPKDEILAAADGTVAYVNRTAALSNFGNYLVLRHPIEGLEIVTLYAHLASVREELRVGSTVTAGEKLGVMGRTTNTRQRIAPERAHLHFEVGLVANPRFAQWHQAALPGVRNDHGDWNGRNLLGLDPRALLLQQRSDGRNFSLLKFIRSQTEICRVLVRKNNFSYAQEHRPLTRRNPVAEKEGIAGYELILNFNGVPCQLVPRAASELKPGPKYQLLSVNEAEQRKNGCRKLVVSKSGRWELGPDGVQLLDLLTF